MKAHHEVHIMAVINTTFSSIASNETQLENGLRAVYIAWYVLSGSTGLLGNTFILIVFFHAKRLQTAKIVVSWLAFVDLIGCLTIPFRYLILLQTDKLSKQLCIAIPPILHFTSTLTLFSLVVAAVERYRAVRFVNKLQNYRNDAVLFASIAFSVLLASFAGAMSRFQVQLDHYEDGTFHCTPVSLESFPDSPDIMEKVTRALSGLIILRCITVITVLYIKIALSLRRRIAAGLPNTHRQPNCSTDNSAEHNAAPTDDNNEESKSFQGERWDGIYELCTSPNRESKGVADVNEIEPEILSITSNPMTENQGEKYSSLCLKPDLWTRTLSRSASPLALDVVPPQKASAMVLPHTRVISHSRDDANLPANTSTSAATTSKALSHSSSQTVKVTRERAATINGNVSLSSCQLLGVVIGGNENVSPSTRPRQIFLVSAGYEEARTVITASNQNASLASCQLPGAVLGDNKNASATNSPSIRPRHTFMFSSGNEEAAIPTLEEVTNHKRGLHMITKTTLMLFIATVMCIITYGIVALFFKILDSSEASGFLLELMLIIHVINPFVYNFVNEWFRDECRDVFKKIKIRCSIQKESSLEEDH